MSENDAENHVADADVDADIIDVRALLVQYAQENALTKRRLDQQDRLLELQAKMLRRRGIAGLIAATLALAGGAYIGITAHSSNVRAEQTHGSVLHTNASVDQTLKLAQSVINPQAQAQSRAQTAAYLKLSCLRNAQQAYDTAVSVTPVPPSLLTKLQQDCG